MSFLIFLKLTKIAKKIINELKICISNLFYSLITSHSLKSGIF